ncbi:hypothetical protein V2J09_016125 [Rumex salicifolius]
MIKDAIENDRGYKHYKGGKCQSSREKALYCDMMNLFGEEPEKKFPIISGYTSELFKLKQNQHSSCGFDRGYVREAPVLAPLKPKPTPIIEEEVEGAAEEQEAVRNDDNTFAGVDFGNEVEGGPFYRTEPKTNDAIEKIINLNILCEKTLKKIKKKKKKK